LKTDQFLTCLFSIRDLKNGEELFLDYDLEDAESNHSNSNSESSNSQLPIWYQNVSIEFYEQIINDFDGNYNK